MNNLVLSKESFSQVWPDARPLAEAHFLEVDGGVEPRRKLLVDEPIMLQLEQVGMLQIFTARVESILVGYCTWNVFSDPESKGLLIAQQGAWFVKPSIPGVGFSLFRFARQELVKLRVQCMYPHHRLQGRGQELGKWFTRLGAKPTQITYSLWIGD